MAETTAEDRARAEQIVRAWCEGAPDGPAVYPRLTTMIAEALAAERAERDTLEAQIHAIMPKLYEAERLVGALQEALRKAHATIHRESRTPICPFHDELSRILAAPTAARLGAECTALREFFDAWVGLHHPDKEGYMPNSDAVPRFDRAIAAVEHARKGATKDGPTS